MKVCANRRWKGPKNEAVAPKDFKIEQSADRRVYNFMKMNAENLQRMSEHQRQQNVQSGDIDQNSSKNDDDKNKN